MNEFILFLKDYWKLIVAGVFFIASLVIAIIRKKPVLDILSDIYYYAILAINDVEAVSLIDKTNKGKSKLDDAILLVKSYLVVKYPTIDANLYEKYIKEVIEKILTTPQKKG